MLWAMDQAAARDSTGNISQFRASFLCVITMKAARALCSTTLFATFSDMMAPDLSLSRPKGRRACGGHSCAVKLSLSCWG